MPFPPTLLSLFILVPAGLAGIWLGVSDLLANADQLAATFGEIWQSLTRLLPLCQFLPWLAAGVLILALAVIVLSGSLNFVRSHH